MLEFLLRNVIAVAADGPLSAQVLTMLLWYALMLLALSFAGCYIFPTYGEH